MTKSLTTRRNVLVGGAALSTAVVLSFRGHAAAASMHVLKDPNCGCCSAWIEILENEGFDVTTEAATGTVLTRYKTDKGIPLNMISCHTGEIEGYMIEGHVPVADIRRLLEEHPDAIGLAVPGMPYGSPGMGPGSHRDAYDVHLILGDGSTEVFTRYDAA